MINSAHSDPNTNPINHNLKAMKQLDVTAIFFYNKRDGYVLIEEDGNTQAYKVGQTIAATSWQLSSITTRFAYLTDSNQEIRLSIGKSRKLNTSKAFNNGTIQNNSHQETTREKFLKTTELEPITEGRDNGYMVKTGKNNIVKKFNLKKGDVILSLNGYPLGTEFSDLSAYKSFKETGTAQLQISRQGKTFTITYEEAPSPFN